MTGIRVFVTYVPARPVAERRKPRPIAAPSATVLAGALLAGGGVHALKTTGEPVRIEKTIAFMAAAHSAPGRAAGERLPVVARATPPAPPPDRLAPRGSAAPAPRASSAFTSVAKAPSIESRKAAPPASPIEGRRLDLAGFLEDQGLAPRPPRPSAEPRPAGFSASAGANLASELALEESTTAPEVLASSAEVPAVAEVQSFPTVTVDGVALGAVTMRGDTVHLGGLVGLLRLRLPAEDFQRLEAAPAADSFVSIDALRAAGVEVALDPERDTITLRAH